jgi:hypothetical protein
MKRGDCVMCEGRTLAYLLTNFTPQHRNLWVMVALTGKPARFPAESVQGASQEERGTAPARRTRGLCRIPERRGVRSST